MVAPGICPTHEENRMKSVLKCLLLSLLLAASATATWAAPKGWKNTSVWNLSLITVEAGQDDAYLESLRGFYTTVMEEAIKQKLILSYKILVGSRANPDDFNLIIMTEGPNWANLDGANDRFDALAAKLAGSADKAEEVQKKAMVDRLKMRTIHGNKLMQQIEFIKN
jgi:hypothetical protein